MTTLFVNGDEILWYFPFYFAAFLIGLINSMLWVWSIVSTLRKISPPMNFVAFNVAFWVANFFIWCIIIDLYLAFMMGIKFAGDVVPGIRFYGTGAIITIACILFGLSFIGRLIRATELQRITTLGDYQVELILMLFPPIGLWIIQPKLNRIVRSQALYPPRVSHQSPPSALL